MTQRRDPFEVLGLEARFDVGRETIDARHRELSKTLHPDRYAQAPAAERRLALGRAIEVNDAARALRNPIKRAEALAERLDIPTGEQAERHADPALLMEMMESREALSEHARAKDLTAITKMLEAQQARRERLEEALAEAFARAEDALPAADVGFVDAKATILSKLAELRYVMRFIEEADALEEAISAG